MSAQPDLQHLVSAGGQIAVRVTPRASRNTLEVVDGQIRVRVTAPPADGQANAVVRRLLARALGVAPTRLELIRGASGRDKVFRLD